MRVTRHRYEVEGWGTGELLVGNGRLLEHTLIERAPHAPSRGPKGTPRSPENSVGETDARDRAGFVPDLVQRIHSFLAGADTDFADVPLDLDWATPFQRAALDVLRALPRGELVTYGELAALAGAPGAARAAGSVCAQNRFWLIVPCHRVVAADGIGGYGSSGVELKRRLLALEGVDTGAL